MIPYQTFLSQHGSLSRDQFLATVVAPHVLITQTVYARDAGFQTVKFTKEAVSESGERRGAMILAVQKRPDANAFGMMITIGRAANNDLVIEHQKISKFHAYFREAAPNEWRICDANSRNGSEVGEVPLTPGQEGLPVHSGTRIRLGKAVSLVFLTPKDLYTRCLADS